MDLLSASKSETVFKNQSIHLPGLTDSQDDTQAQEVTPEAFYFVKLSDSEGQKIFVNMCGCSEIAAPGEWQSGVPPELEESFSLMEANADYGTQNLRFSLSCSDCILSTDKQGNLCKVYDVVFNLVVMRHSVVHKQLRMFLINMSITWINQKYGIELKPDYKLPRGKYKGKIVRKHHIRASKAPLVTEIPDLQPSFPLLSIKVSQTLDTQVDLTNSEQLDKLPSTMEPILRTHQSLTESLPSDFLEDKPATSLQHGRAAQSLSDSFQEGPQVDKVHCEMKSDENVFNIEEKLLEKDSKVQKEEKDCGTSSPIFGGQNNGSHELGDGMPSQDLGMPPPFKQMPVIQTKYLGCPTELVVMCITFPTSVEVQEVKVWASKTQLYFEAATFDPMTVKPLILTMTLATNTTAHAFFLFMKVRTLKP